MSKVLFVTGNAGQGKTTVAKGLALALRSFGFDVLLVDGDTRTPKLRYHAGLPLADRCIQDALAGRCELSETVYLKPSGLKVVLSVPDASVPHPASLLSELRRLAQVVVVDVPVDERWFAAGGEVIAVTQPDFPSLLEMNKLAKQVPLAGVIVNRAHAVDLSPGNVVEVLKVPVLGFLSEDSKFREALRHGHSVVEFDPDADASIVLRMIAAKLMNVEYRPPRKRAPLLAKLGLW